MGIVVGRAAVCMADDVIENKIELERIEGECLRGFVERVLAEKFLPMAGGGLSSWVLVAGERELAVIGAEEGFPRYVAAEETPFVECFGAGEPFFNRKHGKTPEALREELVNKRLGGGEVWDLFDAERKPLGRTHPRGRALAAGEYHLVAEVWTLDSSGRILLTKRHPDKSFPGMWECTGGAVLAGEDPEYAAMRELREETGLVADVGELELVRRYAGDDTHYDVWLFRSDAPQESLVLQAGEVTEAKWVGLAEFEKMLFDGEIIPKLGYLRELAALRS